MSKEPNMKIRIPLYFCDGNLRDETFWIISTHDLVSDWPPRSDQTHLILSPTCHGRARNVSHQFHVPLSLTVILVVTPVPRAKIGLEIARKSAEIARG